MDIYSTGAIQAVVRALPTPNTFLYDLFFRNMIQSPDAEILFDVEIKKQRVAPLVAPHVPGRLVANSGYRTDRFDPAYVKDKRAIDPRRPLKRGIGEQIGGAPALTPAQREAAILAETLQDMTEMLQRREELMAADALIDGIVTVTGDGYESKTVNFGRAAGHSVALSGTAEWGDSGVSPIANLEDWSGTFLDNSGLPVTDVVFCGFQTWRDFRADSLFKDSVDMTLRGTQSEATPNIVPEAGGVLMGTLNGKQKLWLYGNKYHNDSGTLTNYVPDNSVILGNSSPDGSQTRCYGAIIDPELDYAAERFAVKSWCEKDPGQRLILMQSAPLPVLSRPNATFYASTRA